MHALWLPIVLSAVAGFVVSSVIHMATPWHKGDYLKVPNQLAVMDALRPFNIPPGDYMVPRPDGMADMKSAEFKELVTRGPKVVMTVMQPGWGAMGGMLGGWFVYLLVVFAFSAFVAGSTLPAGAEYMHVFQIVAVTAFLGLSGALWQMNIWYKRSLGTTIRSTIDGLIYALIGAGLFGWLWPH
jgi:hypothetical protein